MPLVLKEISDIVSILGKKGAFEGLKYSKFSNSELYESLLSHNIKVPKKTKRDDLIQFLLLASSDLIGDDYDELLKMNRLELNRYFSENKASNAEISEILSALGIESPKSKRVNLLDFATQEISELGMFKRIADGS